MKKISTLNYGIIFCNCNFADYHLLKHLILLYNLQNLECLNGILHIYNTNIFNLNYSQSIVIILNISTFNELFKFYEFLMMVEKQNSNNDLLFFSKNFELLNSPLIYKTFSGDVFGIIFFKYLYLLEIEFNLMFDKTQFHFLTQIVDLICLKYKLLHELKFYLNFIN